MSEKLMPYQVFINYLRRKKGKEPKYGEDVSETGDYSPEIADVDVSESGGDYDDSIEHVQVDVDESTEGQKSFDAPSLAKRKKMFMLVGAIAILIVAAFMMTSNPEKKQPVVTARTVQKAPAEKLPPQLNVTSLIEESARQDVQSEKDKRNKELAALKQQIHRDVLAALEKNKKTMQKAQPDTPDDVRNPGASVADGASPVGVTQYYPPPPQNGSVPQGGQQAMMNPALAQPSIGGSFRVVSGSPFAFEKSEPTDAAQTVATSALDANASIDSGNAELDAGVDVEDTYVPSGSFVKGMILTGADVPAPVGQSARTDPYPILIHLTDDSFGPNRTRRRIKECFIVAAGKGDLSLERAIFRTSTLSCEYMDGSKLDTQVKGYIVDSDGRVGLRGKVITRNGSKIALTLLAGFGQGFGTAAAAAGATQSITGAGIATTTAPNQVLKSSAFSGVGSAAGKLADYYGAMAKAIYPVIEVPAMRKVTVVVLNGFSLKPNIQKGN